MIEALDAHWRMDPDVNDGPKDTDKTEAGASSPLGVTTPGAEPLLAVRPELDFNTAPLQQHKESRQGRRRRKEVAPLSPKRQRQTGKNP